MAHLYEQFKGTPLWRAVEDALSALLDNGDLKLETQSGYVVGFICQQLSALPSAEAGSKKPADRFSLQEGDARGWIEQAGSIHLKVATVPHGDPVELTPEEARELAAEIQLLAAELERLDRG